MRNGYCDLEEIARWIFRQVAEGLRHLHSDVYIAHRDIKPDNILYFTAKGSGFLEDEESFDDNKEADIVKISDFTVALELGAPGQDVRVNDR
jgi:serine/threonine protein kinase